MFSSGIKFFVTKCNMPDYIIEGGDEVPFEEIYKEYYGIVFGFLFNMSKNESVSEELTAETFYKAFKTYRNFDGKGKISSWLCQIAKNEYFKYYNKHKRLKKLEEVQDLPESDALEDIVQDKTDVLKIHKLLHKLNEPYKEVFILRVFADLSFRDIGLIMDKTETWARVTFYRGKLKLIEQMEDSDE